MDASHEKLASMSESDAVSVSGLPQDLVRLKDLMCSDSPNCVETISTLSDLSQNEIMNGERENESKFTLCEAFCSTVHDLSHGSHTGGCYSENEQVQPVDTSSFPLEQRDPLREVHWAEVANEKMTTCQHLTEGFSDANKPDLQSHEYTYVEEISIKQDSFEEENPVETSLSTDNDPFANECVRQSPSSPALIYCSGETWDFTETSLAACTARESALLHPPPQSCFCEDDVPYNVEKPSYKCSFSRCDLRANDKTQETEVASKEIQNFGEISEMSVHPQEEVTVESMGSPEIVSTWRPADVSWSDGAARQKCRTPDKEQSFESLQPLEEDMALNEVLKKLKHTNRRQQMRIQDLQCSNLYLEKKVRELQGKTAKQQGFVDIINKLKGHIEELIEDKYNIILEKNEADRTLQNLRETLADAQRHLQESRKEKEALQLEVRKIKVSFIRLQESYVTEMQQRSVSVNQWTQMDRVFGIKEEGVQRLPRPRGGLEEVTPSALDLLKREKETQELEFLALQEEFQKHEKKNMEERQKLKSRLQKSVTQVKNLQFMWENERAKNTDLQQQVDEVKSENAKLQQQVARSQEQNRVPNYEVAQLEEQLEEVMEPGVTKNSKMLHSPLLLPCSPREEGSRAPPDVKRNSQLASKIHSLLALMLGLLTYQDIINPHAGHFRESEKVSDIMLQILKSFHLKKKNLDKELLKHKDKITTFRELIANEKAFHDHAFEVTGRDSNEAKNVRDLPVLLGAKLDKYHNLNEELDYLVTSYEEIIRCADQRLEMSHSQIALLEERNKHLEDLLRRPRESARKPRQTQRGRECVRLWFNPQIPTTSVTGDEVGAKNSIQVSRMVAGTQLLEPSLLPPQGLS
ncbi:cancer-associated gene 1 protein isoform X4 [Oryctolagus cuniculus]|uniref:cancer-associated gene 1 protein isoform X4 n=1 Tax=Oryctolagus cuniculus TaxID=9986 RepID=UPI00387A6DCB